ncbi:MAG: hypothetical protein ACT4OG_06685 [Alphaproteobacteria bacterium]
MPTEVFRQAISDAYLADEDTLVAGLIEKARMTPAEHAATHTLARDLVSRLRAQHRSTGIDRFMQEYALSSE